MKMRPMLICYVAVQEFPELWENWALIILEAEFHPSALYAAINQASNLNQMMTYRLQKKNKHPPAICVTVKQF